MNFLQRCINNQVTSLLLKPRPSRPDQYEITSGVDSAVSISNSIARRFGSENMYSTSRPTLSHDHVDELHNRFTTLLAVTFLLGVLLALCIAYILHLQDYILIRSVIK